MKTVVPQPNALSWYPTQAETLQRQRDQLATSKRDAHAFAQNSSAKSQVRWWTRVFWRV